MSVLINDMEMPTERESFTITVKYNGIVLDTETGIKVAEAHEVPEHGRLIDADALDKMLEFIEEAEAQIYGRDSWGFTRKCRQALFNAPTVISAEEGE